MSLSSQIILCEEIFQLRNTRVTRLGSFLIVCCRKCSVWHTNHFRSCWLLCLTLDEMMLVECFLWPVDSHLSRIYLATSVHSLAIGKRAMINWVCACSGWLRASSVPFACRWLFIINAIVHRKRHVRDIQLISVLLSARDFFRVTTRSCAHLDWFTSRTRRWRVQFSWPARRDSHSACSFVSD